MTGSFCASSLGLTRGKVQGVQEVFVLSIRNYRASGFQGLHSRAYLNPTYHLGGTGGLRVVLLRIVAPWSRVQGFIEVGHDWDASLPGFGSRPEEDPIAQSRSGFGDLVP